MTDSYTLIFANGDGEHFTRRRAEDGTLTVEGTLPDLEAVGLVCDIARELELVGA